MKRLTQCALAVALSLPPHTAALAQAAAAQSKGLVKPDARAPAEIVAGAPAADWVAIAASDLLVLDLAADEKGRARRVIIQLMPPPFSQGWIGNIRKLAAAHWYDGTSINRVQDNYVVQWGDANADDNPALGKEEFERIVAERVKAFRKAHPRARKAEIDQAIRGVRQAAMNEDIERVLDGAPSKAKALPDGLGRPTESDYMSHADNTIEQATLFYRMAHISRNANLLRNGAAGIEKTPNIPVGGFDSYGFVASFSEGWPVATDAESAVWPVHCYGMVGVGRNLSPDTGTGAELYTVIGHAPRHLDRNVALVGRVIEGIEHLSSLPRGTEALGFYKTPEERVPIKSIRLATELTTNDIPRFEYLSTESDSFAAYADARANRRDPFFIKPAGGADVCNIPVPVRRAR